MSLRLFALLVFAALTLAAIQAEGQAERASAENSETLELVDRLKEVIRRAERNRKTDPATLNQLRELVRRYDWPWRVKLLYDDFNDGDYTANPAWVVSRGDFWVVPGAGLRTIVAAGVIAGLDVLEKKDAISSIDIVSGIRKGVLQPGAGAPQFRGALPTAEISTPVAIGNAFAIRVRMVSGNRNTSGSRIEFGPFRGNDRDWGYRLAYNPGQSPSFEVVRIWPGRSAVLERFNAVVSIEDENAHTLDWRCDRDGNILVLLDGKPIIRAADRAAVEFFDGFTIVNGGGDYTFERIEILGTER